MLAKLNRDHSLSCDVILNRRHHHHHNDVIMNTYQKLTARKRNDVLSSRKRKSPPGVPSEEPPRLKCSKPADADPAADVEKQNGGSVFSDGDAAEALLGLCNGLKIPDSDNNPMELQNPTKDSLSRLDEPLKDPPPSNAAPCMGGGNKFQHFKKAICRQFTEESSCQDPKSESKETGNERLNQNKESSSSSEMSLSTDFHNNSQQPSTSGLIKTSTLSKLYRISTLLSSSESDLDNSDLDSTTTSDDPDDISILKRREVFTAKSSPFSSTSPSPSSSTESDCDVIINSVPLKSLLPSRKFVLSKARFSAPSSKTKRPPPASLKEKLNKERYDKLQEESFCHDDSVFKAAKSLPEQHPDLETVSPNYPAQKLEAPYPNTSQLTQQPQTSTMPDPKEMSSPTESREKVESPSISSSNQAKVSSHSTKQQIALKTREKLESSTSDSSPNNNIFRIRKPSFLFCTHNGACRCGRKEEDAVVPHNTKSAPIVVKPQQVPPETPPTLPKQQEQQSAPPKARKRRRKRAPPHMRLVNSTVFSVLFKRRFKQQSQDQKEKLPSVPPEVTRKFESTTDSSDSDSKTTPPPVRHPPRKRRRKTRTRRKSNQNTEHNNDISVTSSCVPMRCGGKLPFDDVTSDDVTMKPLKAVNFRLSSLFSLPPSITSGVARAELMPAVKSNKSCSDWTIGDDVTMTKQRRQRDRWRAMTLDMFCMGGC